MADTDQDLHSYGMKAYITYESVLFGIVVWDWLVCLGSEYRHVWKAKRSTIQLLYLLSRYISLVLTTIVFALNYLDQPHSTCNLLVRFNCAAITLIQAISLAVLAQRAYFVSMRSKTILALLGLFIVALITCGITHAVLAVETSPATMENGHGTCRVQALEEWKPLTTAFFVIPVVGHAVATIIVLVQTRKHLPHNGVLSRRLIVDGVLYLLAVDAVGLVQLIFFTSAGNHQLAMMNAAALLSLTSVFCCRFILHLRERAGSGSQLGTTEFASQADWTNNFGAPLEAGQLHAKELARPVKSMLGSKHQLSRFRDSGTATVHTIPELQVLDSIDSTLPHVDAPITKVEIKQDVLRKIDTISDSEAEDDKP